MPFQNNFLFSFLQLHKTVSIKFLQRRITKIHSELLKLQSRSAKTFLEKQKKKRFLETGVAERQKAEVFISNIDEQVSYVGAASRRSDQSGKEE